MRPGLVSITFRKLSPREVVEWTTRACLEGIEWGGDVHVPHGNLDAARDVAAMTRDAGLEVAAYGSYYRAGHDPETFGAVLETARTMDTSILRVWCGKLGSDQADPEYRRTVTEDCRRISALAGEAGIRVACEWHGNTLTDTVFSALELFRAVNHPNFRTYWQPRRQQPFALCLKDLVGARPRLVGVHVFHWDPGTGERLPLAAGEDDWREYLTAVRGWDAEFALLEFVRDDDPEQMVRDAAVLRRLLAVR